MKRSRKQQIKKLLQQKESCRWEIAEIYNSNMDPDMKALYLNDVQYKQYCIEQKIDDLEHEIAMFPLQLMLAGFIIFVIGMLIYR
jgi:uncharacterized membrane protein